MEQKTDNTVLTNGIIKNGKFYPKKNLPSGTLRIVLTTKCNFNCIYCFSEGEENKEYRILNLEDLKKILVVAKEFGISNIKLTGGEPLLYPYIRELLSYIRKIEIPYIDLTTNISCLNEKNIEVLNEYNVNAITLSLNTLNKEKFMYLSKFNDFDLIMNNLNLAFKHFKGKLRINCIIFDDQYDEEDYNKIIKLCKNKKIGLRLIEPSIVEGLKITYNKKMFKSYINNIKKKANKIIESDCKSVEYIFLGDWYLTVMHSLCDNKLCDSCIDYMYIRVTSDLKLKPCLSRRDTEVSIDTSNIGKIREAFINAITNIGVGVKNEIE
mgnify:CR=1 FL=1